MKLRRTPETQWKIINSSCEWEEERKEEKEVNHKISQRVERKKKRKKNCVAGKGGIVLWIPLKLYLGRLSEQERPRTVKHKREVASKQRPKKGEKFCRDLCPFPFSHYNLNFEKQATTVLKA